MGQKNFRRVPPGIVAKIRNDKTPTFVVACVQRVDVTSATKFRDLGVTVDQGRLKVTPRWVPNASQGKYSRANREGRDVVRKDLPMTTNTDSC